MTLNEIRGRHAGRPGVVMGSGPSLRFVDERIYKYVTFAVNSSFVKFPKSDYYCTSDYGIMDTTGWQNVIDASCPVVFFNWGLSPQYVMNGIDKSRMVVVPKERKHVMRASDTVVVFGESSAHCALHFALILGCSPVYLVGCDCTYRDGKKSFFQFDGQPRDATLRGNPSSWVDDRIAEGMHPRPSEVGPGWGMNDIGEQSDGYLGSTFTEWKSIRDVNPELAGKIIDASQGRLSIGKVFPSITTQQLLERAPT